MAYAYTNHITLDSRFKGIDCFRYLENGSYLQQGSALVWRLVDVKLLAKR